MRWLELCDVLSFSLKKHGLTFQCPEPTARGSQTRVSLQPPGVGVPAERVCSEPSPGPWNLHLGAPSVAHGPLSRALLGEILHTPHVHSLRPSPAGPHTGTHSTHTGTCTSSLWLSLPGPRGLWDPHRCADTHTHSRPPRPSTKFAGPAK